VQQNSSRYYAAAEHHAESLIQRFIAKIRWLLTKEGRPYLLVIALGFLIGAFVDGAWGLLIATVLGLALFTFLKKFSLPLKPWQATVTTLWPIVARLCFMMILLLPVANGTVGLLLPSGHYPDTFMKYLSIMIVIPKNIVSNAPIVDVFPGIPIIVALSIILMFWGSLNLYKRKNFTIALSGLILYTISPAIASAAVPTHFNTVTSYAAGYYLGWVGLVLIVVDKFFLQRILKAFAPVSPSPTVQRANRLLGVLPILAFTVLITQLQGLNLHIQLIAFQDLFEAEHHAVASLLSGIVAGVGAGVIMESVSPPGDSGNNPPDQTTLPEAPTATVPPAETTPTTPPQQEPTDIDEINQAKKQREIDEKYMSAFEKDRQQQINDDTIKAANDDKALHDEEEHMHDETKKFWKDYYTDENEFNSWTAEHEITKAEGYDKLMETAEYTKSGCDKFIYVAQYFAGPAGKKIADAYDATSEFAESAADGKPGEGIAKAGIKVGEEILEHVGMHTLEHTLGHDSDLGKFVHYVNEEGEPPEHISLESLNEVAVDMTKDKIKGLGPEQLGDYVKKKTGLEGSEGGSEGAEPAEGEAPASGE
jgi:hypothetical protein